MRGRAVQRGVKLAERGDLEGAIAAHEAALVQEPSLAEAHANLIALYGRARNFAKADEHYRAVVALGVNLSTAHYDYGVLLGLQEKWDLAADAYRQAIAVNPLHAQAHHNLGQILERQRQLDAAADAYRRASRVSRRSGSRDSTSDACCWRSDVPTPRSWSSRS